MASKLSQHPEGVANYLYLPMGDKLPPSITSRGFKSSNDPATCWYAYRHNDGKKSFTFRCHCGLEHPITPDSSGIASSGHPGSRKVKIQLEGYDVLMTSVADRRKLRDKKING